MKRALRLFFIGLRDGTPIALGYFAVSFAFGIQARKIGLTAFETFSLSATNLTSAGQFAGLSVIETGGTILAMVLTMLVINLRYCLMSCALSQKLAPTLPLYHRFLIAFGMTDEIFAVSVSVNGHLRPQYSYGLILISLFGWSFGSLCGALAGNILPPTVVEALGMALFAMFVAIVVPDAIHDHKVLVVVLMTIVISLLFTYLPGLSDLSVGMRTVWITLIASTIAAVLFPKREAVS